MAITAAPIAAVDAPIVRSELFRPDDCLRTVAKIPEVENVARRKVSASTCVHLVVAVGLLVLVEIVVSHGHFS